MSERIGIRERPAHGEKYTALCYPHQAVNMRFGPSIGVERLFTAGKSPQRLHRL